MDKAEMLRQKLDGYTYAEIGQAAGISRQRVQQLLSPPVRVRREITERAQWTCENCGLHVASSGHVHHKGSSNGEDWNDTANLQLLCVSCHRSLHQRGLSAEANPSPYHHQCLRCGHKWGSEKERPSHCASCKLTAWDRAEQTMTCEWCASAYQTYHSAQRYCSSRCQIEAKAERQRQRRVVSK